MVFATNVGNFKILRNVGFPNSVPDHPYSQAKNPSL